MHVFYRDERDLKVVMKDEPVTVRRRAVVDCL